VIADEATADVHAPALRIAIVEWAPGDELIAVLAQEIAQLGHDVTLLAPTATLPSRLDVLLLFGPFGPIAALTAQLAERPPGRRPLLVWWMTEQLWHPALPHWIARGTAELRAGFERLMVHGDSRAVASWRRRVTRRGLRFRYYGDLLWLRRQGLLSVLAVPSQWLGAFLERRGFEVTPAFLGGHSSFAAEPSATRDIPVLWVGTYGSPRRRRNVEWITGELARRGVEVTVIDGVRHAPVYGPERNRLFSRAKIALNLLRQPWDSNLLRFALAAPNGALMISERMLAHYPVHDGIHLVETPLDQMAEVVCRYLEDDDARARIVDRAHTLVSTELTMAHGVRTIMRKVVQARAAAA